MNLKVGQSVTGTNIAQNTRIASITNATTFVMDKNPNQSGTSVALSFGYHVSSAILGGEESQASSSGFVQSPDTVTIETGDWFILNILTGTGTVSEPYIAQFSIVNNTYELMKGAVAPVMSGEVIVTEAVAGAPGLVPGPSAEDYLKFLRGDGTWQVATENSTDAFLLDRENHEGTQDASTISDFDTAVAANSAVTANTAKVTNADHTGDVTGTTELTIGDGKVSFSKIQDVSGYSVMGRSGSTTAAVEAIQASINGHVLRRTTSGLDFGTIAGDSIDSKAISFEKIQDSGAAGLSVIGRSANSSGAFNEIAAGTNGHVLTRISDNSLGFGQVKKAGIENGAVDTDQLAADSVSNVKLANMAAFKIKGNNSDIEADPGDLSPLQIRDMSNLVAIFIGAAMENPNNENDKTNTPVDKSNGMVDGSAIPTGTI